jgi:coproporphyrinogen III oxidase-like Fe-S oxidoreductase
MSSDLDHLLDLEPPHISLYQLTVETGTPLAARVQAGKLKMVDQELAMAMYRGACEKMAEMGYVRYEVSSFAKPGYECKHNLGYWEGADYVGLGPSAHSFIDDQRYYNKPNTVEYLTALEKGERPIVADQSDGGGNHVGVAYGARYQPTAVRKPIRPPAGGTIRSQAIRYFRGIRPPYS